MRRFLYISFFFPPCGGAESRHNVNQIRTLVKHGLVPTVITTPDDVDYPKDEGLRELIPEGIEIKRFPWPYRRDSFTSKARRVGRFPENPLVFKSWKDIYDAAKAEAVRHEYEFIYSVYGIASAHMAAWRLKRELGLKWVAEFRDPMVDNWIIWQYMRDHSWGWWYRHEMSKTRIWQERVMAAADLVVVESPEHGELLVSEYGLDKHCVVPFGMGYAEECFLADSRPLLKFTQVPVIGFIGSLYYGYDDTARRFIAALKEMEEKGYRFTFVSVGESSSRFSAFAREIGLQSIVPVAKVSHAQALALMKAMDLGLVCVGQEYRSNINSKLWEYLRANLSILGLVPDDGAMARVITDGRCGYILPYGAAGMRDILRRALDDYRQDRLLRARPDFIAGYSRKKIGVELAKKIEEMLCS